MGDPFEGSFPKENIRLRPKIFEKLPDEVIESFTSRNKEMRKYFIVNCWHQSDYESSAMWKIYAKQKAKIWKSVRWSSWEDLYCPRISLKEAPMKRSKSLISQALDILKGNKDQD